jgi:hypothetical protein
MKLQSFALLALLMLTWGSSPASDRGTLQLTIEQENIVTRSDVVAPPCPEEGDSTSQLARLEWKNLTLQRGKQISSVPVDIIIEFLPEFGARFGNIITSVIDIASGRLVVDPMGRAETWEIRQGNYGNQAARLNFNTQNGNLHLTLPVVLENNTGVRAGTNLVAICSNIEGSWLCTKGSVVFENMRRDSQPNAEIDDVISNWISSEPEKLQNPGMSPQIGPVEDCCVSAYRCQCSNCSASTSGDGIDPGCKFTCRYCRIRGCEECTSSGACSGC